MNYTKAPLSPPLTITVCIDSHCPLTMYGKALNFACFPTS